jgi:hypothetical protein
MIRLFTSKEQSPTKGKPPPPAYPPPRHFIDRYEPEIGIDEDKTPSIKELEIRFNALKQNHKKGFLNCIYHYYIISVVYVKSFCVCLAMLGRMPSRRPSYKGLGF